MRHVLALFDAPVPAARALAALWDAGFAAADVSCVPAPPGVHWGRETGFARLPADDPPALERALSDLGIGHADAHAYAEGVRRGGILVTVRTPTLSAPVAVAALDSSAPPDLATHQARWAVDPDLSYRWQSTPPPRVDPPAPGSVGGPPPTPTAAPALGEPEAPPGGDRDRPEDQQLIADS
jgi:hypothetical protein